MPAKMAGNVEASSFYQKQVEGRPRRAIRDSYLLALQRRITHPAPSGVSHYYVIGHG